MTFMCLVCVRVCDVVVGLGQMLMTKTGHGGHGWCQFQKDI